MTRPVQEPPPKAIPDRGFPSGTPARYVLGLDLSLQATGIVLLREGQAVASGVISPAPRKGVERLDYIEREVMRRVEECPPEITAIEGYSMGSRGNVLFNIGELGGVIRLALHRRGLRYVEVAPGSWRKQLCGRGNLPKDQVRVELWKRYEVTFESLDELEAWAVAMSLWRVTQGLDKPARSKRRRPAEEAVAR